VERDHRESSIRALDRYEIFSFPVPPLTDYKALYIPLEKTSALVQELYGYHPDKAKQLLKEAGYPDGFDTTFSYPMDRQSESLAVIAPWLR
jgi:peptide/nickel transport system substrate-binding protein